MYSEEVFVDLIDLRIEPFGLHLLRGRDLMTGRPYPDRRYIVGCRKKGRKAIDGILLKTSEPVTEIHLIARWCASGPVVTHRVHYTILDQEFGAASDKMALWRGTERGHASRVPDRYREFAPIHAEPLMQLVDSAPARWMTKDVIDFRTGWISDRSQRFAMPSIQPERLMELVFSPRMPAVEDAFEVQISKRPCRVPLRRSQSLVAD